MRSALPTKTVRRTEDSGRPRPRYPATRLEGHHRRRRDHRRVHRSGHQATEHLNPVLNEKFLAEVRGLKHKNVAAELLAKLLKDEIKQRGQRNVV